MDIFWIFQDLSDISEPFATRRESGGEPAR